MSADLALPARLLMGSGPTNPDPRVLRVMATGLVGQFDPAFTALMGETQELLRRVFRTRNRCTFPVPGTSRAGMEAAVVSLVEPGERVLVVENGRFGLLFEEIARRAPVLRALAALADTLGERGREALGAALVTASEPFDALARAASPA
jgi:(S)-ureidoglycine-glyoxylate aminotransferase